MKGKTLVILLIAKVVKSVTLLATVGRDPPYAFSVSLAGPNQEWMVQGKILTFTAFSINWQNGHVSFEKSITPKTIPGVTGNTRIHCDLDYNCVVGTRTIFRFNMKPGASDDLETYPVRLHVAYGTPRSIVGTSYVIVSARAATTAETKKAYRILSDRVTDVKTYNTGTNSASYGVLYGTGWLLVSIENVNKRRLYDYTNGYEGGTNSSIQIHTKVDNKNENGFFTPEDGRELYVVSVSGGQIKRMHSIEYDGTSWLYHDLPSFLGVVQPAVWVRDSDLCIVPSWGTNFAIVNFVDKNKPDPVYYNMPTGARHITKLIFWSYYKGFILSNLLDQRSYVYKALTETPCADLCTTCDGVYRKKCLTCDPNSSKSGEACNCYDGFYERNISPTKKECLACSQFCATCSGGAATHCLTCKYSYMEKKSDGSCGCLDGTYLSGFTCPLCDGSCLTCSGPGPSACLSCRPGSYLHRMTCSTCHPECKTCSGGSSRDCLSCPEKGYLLNLDGICFDCALQDSPQCSPPTKITPPSSIEEMTQNLVISFSPALDTSLPPNFLLTADLLLEKYLSLKFKRKEEILSKDLTIINKILTHQKDSTILLVEFLQKMRFSNTDYLSLEVTDVKVYDQKTSGTGTGNQIVYFKNQTYTIKITEKEESEEEKNQEQVARVAKVTRAAVGATATTTSVIVAFSGSSSCFFAYLAKFFNLMDILSNLASINVEFGSRFKLIMSFIVNLKIPEIGVLARMSPIKDSEIDDSDVNAYRLKPRGTRAKMTQENDQVFIISGKNFVFSSALVFIWLLLTIFGFCMEKNGKVLGFFAFLYQLMIGLVFYDFQMICSTEVAFFNYSGIRNIPEKFIFSLMISLFVVTLIVSDFGQAFVLIKRGWMTKNGGSGGIGLSSNERLVLERYTEGVNMKCKGVHNYFTLISNIRFFLIQIVISSLQLLNRTQALLILLINLCFFVFFVKVACSVPTFSSKLMLIKEWVQECCIMVVLMTITLFSFTEKTDFSNSIFYQMMEVVAVVSMIGAAGSEFIILCSSILESFKSCYIKRKRVSKIQESKNRTEIDKIFEEGGTKPDRLGHWHQKLQDKRPQNQQSEKKQQKMLGPRKRFIFPKSRKSRAMRSLAAKSRVTRGSSKTSSPLEGWSFRQRSEEIKIGLAGLKNKS